MCGRSATGISGSMRCAAYVSSRTRIASILASTVLACSPSRAADRRYEFLTGETICVDADRVVEQRITGVFGGGQKVASLSVQPDAVVLTMEPDKLFNEAYYRDLATFIETYPDSVSLDPSGAFYKLDISMRPPAEVDSLRLRDRLMPGDGSMSIVVSRSIRSLPDEAPIGDAKLAEIVLVMCWSNEHGNPRCERRFPFLGFRVSYPLPGGWEMIAERDREIRSHLEKLAKSCR